jgi:hypothetical protein
MAEPKPVGSGYFSVFCGCVFLAVLVGDITKLIDVTKLSPPLIIRIWFAFVTAVLLIWGASRIATGNKGDKRIGQDTINFVVSIAAATIALLGLVKS